MAKVALLIGVSEYGLGLNPLPGAVKDVEAIREVLLHSDIGGFGSEDVMLLKNPERQEMEEAIERLFTYRQKDDLVLLYFSGHGIKNDLGQLYLATQKTRKNSKGELVRSTAVAANFVQQCMSVSRSRRQVVILDSCFSGAFAEGMFAKDDGSVDIRTELGGEGRAVLTSSTSTQYSFEEKGEDLSIYTRFLLEGIRTGAADLDDDGVISIDELHEYASRKVQELQPAMKPELYAIREGFKIRLTKVPPGDPLQKYRKEVARFIHRGEISFVGRRTLDVLRSRLKLEPTAAQAIEDEVLEPYRQEFHNKLQQYEQVFTDVLQREQTITEGDRADLQNLQQILGLRNEDTVPIEAVVTARLKTHQKNLQVYEQTFDQTLRQEFPLNDVGRTRLAQLKQQLELTDAEVSPVEMRITAEVESFHQKLQQYKQLFVAAIQQSYPLSDGTRNELQQQQESFGLSKVDVAPIEAKITTEIETYQQKLQQYEQAYVNATQRKYHLSESDRKQLEQTWQTLGLREEDVRAIASQINAQVESYQANLRQYEQEFAETTQKQYPLSEAKQHELKQRQQTLNLSDKDVSAIEFRIITDIEEYQQKLQQYEQVFAESIQYEYPLTNETREELKRFQQILELSDETVTQIEERILASEETVPNSDPDSPIVNQLYQAEDVNTELPEILPAQQEVEPQDLQTNVREERRLQKLQRLQQYELEATKLLQAGTSLKDGNVRKRLNHFGDNLGLTLAERKTIEWRLSTPSLVTVPPPQVPSQYRRENPAQPETDFHSPVLYQTRKKSLPLQAGATKSTVIQHPQPEVEFWRQWLSVTVTGSVIGVLFGGLVGIAISQVSFSTLDHSTAILVGLVGGGFVFGCIVGLFQSFVIKRSMWILKTAMIGIVSVVLFRACLAMFLGVDALSASMYSAILGTLAVVFTGSIMVWLVRKQRR